MQKNIEITRQITQGTVLISVPFLPDENFFRTVVFICNHTKEGSFGYILNKKTELRLNDVIAENHTKNDILYEGGPVETNTLHFIHNNFEELGGEMIIDGLFLGGDYQKAISEFGVTDLSVFTRFFLGYSGWSSGQLESELEQNSWFLCRVKPELIINTEPEKLWKTLLLELGGEFKLMANYPTDPRLN